MSLRIILKPDQITQWIADRNGTPTRRRGSDTEFRVLFGDTHPDFEPITVDELIEGLRTQHQVMMVDQEPGKTFHKIYAHS